MKKYKYYGAHTKPYSLLVVLFLLLLPSCLFGEDPPELRAVYAATFEINTQSACQNIINDVLSSNINAVFVEVRARADAYYFPNREDAAYPNNEPRGQLYSISPSNLDVLQFFIDQLHSATPPREVHAWCTTYNTWNRSSPPSSPDHLYNAHPEWITENKAGVTYTSDDNAPLDPGIPEVQDHIYNVFLDIVRNYDVDGIHFDYIRLINSDSGFDPVAKQRFLAHTGWNFETDNPQGELDEVYKAWRRDQIARLVQRVHTRTLLEKPWVEVSAFLIRYTDPVENLGQGYNWWVAHNAIDVLHPSCYSSTASGTETNWEKPYNRLKENGDENKIPMVAAIGNWLLVSPGEIVKIVNNLRNHTRKADGFNSFRHAFLFGNENPSQADYLFNEGGPMDDWAPVPPIPHKPEEETDPPNPPASLSVILSEGVPFIAFQKPPPAPDGDLPVHYRLYRDTSQPVKLYYENMIMEWWDPGSPRTSFSFDDQEIEPGDYYYSAVAYDDWNNENSVTTGPITIAALAAKKTKELIPKEPKPPVEEPIFFITEVILESEPTALDYDDAGAWTSVSNESHYGGAARSYKPENFPINSFPVWIADLPRAGYWAIDGYIFGDQASLARGAQYRFTDGKEIVHNVTATQRTGSLGFTINVDGVEDQDAYYFKKGRVYVTLHGNTTGSEEIISDALRFKLIKPQIPDAPASLISY